MHPNRPLYLFWRARKFDFRTRFIELAGKINIAMPYFVLDHIAASLNQRGMSLKDAQVVLLCLA